MSNVQSASYSVLSIVVASSRSLFKFVICAWCSFGSQAAERIIEHDCYQNWACYSITEDEQYFRFYLENKKPFVITSTLTLYRPEKRVETRVLRNQEKVKVWSLAKTNLALPLGFGEDFNWVPGALNAKHNDDYVYQAPYAAGQHYSMVQGFGGGFSHSGASKYALDFAMPIGTPVHAARDGVVIDVTDWHNLGGPRRKYAKYANFIVVLHDDDTTGEYYHLRQYGAKVKVGQKVNVGDHIGYSGNTGFSSLPHLHFAVYRAKEDGNYESIPINMRGVKKRASWQR